MKTIIGNPAANAWGKVRVGDALRLINGRAFKPSEWRERGLPIVRIQNLNRAEAPFNYYEGNLPEKYLLKNGDLLFAWSGTPGTSFGAQIWRGGKAWLNQHIFKVIFDDIDFNKKFLQLAINQNLNEYIGAAHGGAGLAHITKGKFEDSELVKPPLEEQNLIVAEIDTQFSRRDEAVANLKRVKANLKRYKAAVLKAAVEGKLTETWRNQHPDIEPAARLLDRILAECREKWAGKGKYKAPESLDKSNLPELPGNWCWSNLEEIKLFSLYGPRFSSEDYATTGTLVIRTSDISESGKVRRDTAPRLNLTAEEVSKYKLERGDLLFTRTGSLGTLAVFDDTVEAIPGAYLIHYRLGAPFEMAQYIFHFFESPVGQKQLIGGGAGVGRPNLNAPTIDTILIALPPLSEQKRIVGEVERRLSVIDELEAGVQANLTRADRLGFCPTFTDT